MGGWEQSISIATAFGRDQHFICTCAEYRPACVARSWVLGGQWTMGGDRWQCCDHRPPYQHQHQPCNSLPSSARTRPIYEVPGRTIHSQSRLFFAQLGCFIHPPVFPLARPRPGLFLPGFSVWHWRWCGQPGQPHCPGHHVSSVIAEYRQESPILLCLKG